MFFRLEKDRIVKLMALTNSFTWEDLPTTSTDGETPTMASMIPRIKKTVKQMLISVMAFHGMYIVLRLVNSEQRVLTANSFYLFDVSFSPVYEVILLSQVHHCVIRKLLSKIYFAKGIINKMANYNVVKILQNIFNNRYKKR